MSPPDPNDISEELRRVKRDADLALVEASCALRRARAEADMEQWPALLATCGLTPDRVRLYLQLAGEVEPVERPPAPRPVERPRVECGWCAFSRTERGLLPKHLGGPKESAHVVHEMCPECREALDRRLARLQRGPEEPYDGDPEQLAIQHVEEWSTARARLRGVLHFIDRAKEELRGLDTNENVGLRDGASEQLERLTEALRSVQRIAAEMVLISQGAAYEVEDLDDDDDEAEP
jgi:hypothetical protein